LELVDSRDGRKRFPPADERGGFFSEQVFSFNHFTLSHGCVLGYDCFEIIDIVWGDTSNLMK
jgi:hypothetical protein